MLGMGDSGAEAASCVFETHRGLPVNQVEWEKFSCLPFSAGGGQNLALALAPGCRAVNGTECPIRGIVELAAVLW